MRTLCAALLIILALGLLGFATDNLDVYFINVGHGDAILIDAGSWECLLDAGKGVGSAKDTLFAILDTAVGDGKLELAILSHNHWDHYGGFTAILETQTGPYTSKSTETYSIGEFWTSDDREPDTSKEYWATFSGSLKTIFPNPTHLSAPQELHTGLDNDLNWRVLSPSDPAEGGDNDNVNSLVLWLEFKSVSFLFTGDLLPVSQSTMDGWRKREEWPKKDEILILKAPHHGLANSATVGLAAALHPTLTVLSTDAVVPETAACLAGLGLPFLATSTSGTIHLRTDGQTVWITTDTLQGVSAEICPPENENPPSD